MENAVNNPSPALPPSISQGTLSDIERKIMSLNKILMFHENDSIEDKPQEAIDAWNQLGELYKLYFDVRNRVDRQIAYQAEVKRRTVKLKDKRTSDDWGQFLLITINPDPSKLTTVADIRRFVAECRSFFKSYVFDVAEFVFEQRGKREGDYPGIHCHGVVRRCDTPSKIKKEILRRFIVSGICGLEKHVNVKTIDSSEINVTRNYLTGAKQGKNNADGLDKREKQENDSRFRKEYGLESVYLEGEGKLLVPLTRNG